MPHLFTVLKQINLLAVCLHAASVEYDDRISTLSHSRTAGNDQAGLIRTREEMRPERLFGLDIERAGDIVEDEQFGIARKQENCEESSVFLCLSIGVDAHDYEGIH